MKHKEHKKRVDKMSKNIIEYLNEEMENNQEALMRAYEKPKPGGEYSDEVQRIREIEAIKLRDRVQELRRYISVIKRMFPTK